MHTDSLSGGMPEQALATRVSRLDDRITVIDVLRGIALLGMFVVHFIDNFSSAPSTSFEHDVKRFSQLFLSDRFHTMFAILFGTSFALQLRRAQAPNRPFIARFLRRLAALAGFGVIAELVFGFQILFGYAVWGLVLLPLRRLPASALLAIALACGAAQPLYQIGRAAYYTPDISAQEFIARDQAAQTAANARLMPMLRPLRSPDWRKVLEARMKRMKLYYATPILPPADLVYFLLGVIALRLGLYERPGERRLLLAGLALFGVASWAVATWVYPALGPLPLPPAGTSYAPTLLMRWTVRGFGLIRGQWLTFAYMAAILLLAPSGSRALRYLTPLGWTGRMALTNYMLQIAVLSTLFFPYAFGFHLPVRFAPVCAIALFAAQCGLSWWWLRRNTYGPLEWLWRSITYCKIQPTRGHAWTARGKEFWLPQFGCEQPPQIETRAK
jgi:uncharacterized protein